MKVIVPGDLTKIKHTKKFHCPDCGCLFEADEDEYEHESYVWDEYYACKCPTCGKRVIIG